MNIRNAAALAFCVILFLSPNRGFSDEPAITKGRPIQAGGYFVRQLIDPNAENDSFNTHAKHSGLPVTIVSCDVVVTFHVGSHDGDDIYGGTCSVVQNNAEIRAKVCDSRMVWHFGFEPIEASDAVSKENLADFMLHHCVGG